jgi:transposase-like protein
MKINCPKCNKETKVKSIYRYGPANYSEWSYVCDDCNLTINVSWSNDDLS